MPTLNLSIAADADDNSSVSTGSLANSTVLTTGFSAAVRRSFTRFVNVTIPKNATINTATYSVRAADTVSTSTWAVRLYANAVDNAANPADGPALFALALSTAYTDLPANESQVNGTRYSYSIVSVVQEIVNRGGWASGNALNILFIDNGSTVRRRYTDYSNGGAANAAKLDITYTDPVATSPKSLMLMGAG